ncbi:fructose PTS transporter subunit IIA [Fumia xinanensis]|uniref:PTS sugar transporter subunit IIA n=1 Tax=Fumia xinanensis TaxID=2763659 RepID=A0A926E6L2_9FIRM|nr:fructose PTS transporter subunit IIA [Fumia xinanensis]MBC8560111.1 PTS sugar transporter subunit IIA [Fumia xinanensis]
MFAEQRKSIILDMLKLKGSVSLTELTDLFEVSEATIRRDLTELEKRNQLQRTHGGAVSTNLSIFEAGYLEKEQEYLEEKRQIAEIAASLVNDGDTVLLDSGTTTFEIARALRNKKITLITNSATIVTDVAGTPDSNVELICTGGVYRANTRSFIGPDAENFIRNMVPDKVFIAANGFSTRYGATTPNLTEASIKRVMIEAGKEVYLAVDSGKTGKDYFSVIAKPEAFHGIVTDSGMDALTINALRSAGISVINDASYHITKNQEDTDMDITELLKPENMTLALQSTTREDAIAELMHLLNASGAVSKEEEMVRAAMKREEEFSTGIGMQVAIPHAKSQYVNEAAIAFGRSAGGVDWPTEDGENPKMIFLIVVPMEARNQHLKLLAQISRKLVHEEVRNKVLEAKSAEEVIDALR